MKQFRNKDIIDIWLKYYPNEYYSNRNNLKKRTFTEAYNDKDFEYLLFKALFHLRSITGYIKISKVVILVRKYIRSNTLNISTEDCINAMKLLDNEETHILMLKQVAYNCIVELFSEDKKDKNLLIKDIISATIVDILEKELKARYEEVSISSDDIVMYIRNKQHLYIRYNILIDRIELKLLSSNRAMGRSGKTISEVLDIIDYWDNKDLSGDYNGCLE